MQTIQTAVEAKTYTGLALKLLKLIGRGTCNQAQAAKACGCDESYVSQLCKEPEFQKQVAIMIEESVASAVEIDANYDKIEVTLSKRLSDAANMMFGPDQILKTLQFVNAAKKRTASVDGVAGNAGDVIRERIVTLILPNAIRHEYTVNPNGEVLTVNDEELITMDSGRMDAFARQQRLLPQELPKVDTKIRQLPNVTTSKQNYDPWSNL